MIARTLHGFKPQWTARRGIEQLYETFQRVGLKLEDFEGERFKRIAHIKKLVDSRRGRHGPAAAEQALECRIIPTSSRTRSNRAAAPAGRPAWCPCSTWA